MTIRSNFYIGSIVAAFLSSIALISFFMPIRNAGWGTITLITVLLSFCYKHLLFLIKEDWPQHLKRKRLWIIAFTLLYSFLALISLKGEQPFLLNHSFWNSAYIYIGTFFTLSSLVILVILSSLKTEIKLEECPSLSKWNILKYAIPPLAVWFLYLLAFFPAAMTFDSIDHWNQVHTGNLNDWHPLMYTLFIMALTQIWDSPAIVAISQIIIISLIFGYCMLQFEKAGVKPFLLWIVSIIFAISPINGIYSITIWKDILYSTFILFFSTIIFNLVITNGVWLERKQNIWAFWIAAFGIVFLRHNGFPVFIAMLLILLIVFRQQWRPLLVASSSIIILYYVITGPVFHHLNVVPSDPNEALSIPTQQIARVISQDGKLTDEQAEYLNEILPLPLWKQYYHPYITNRIKFSKEYNRSAIFPDHVPTYLRTWIEVCLQNPQIVKEAFLKHTSLVWQMNEPEDGHTYTFVTNILPKNKYNLANKVIFKPLTRAIEQYLTISNTYLKSIIWRPANYMFLIVLFTFVTVLRNNWKAWLVPFTLFLNIGVVFIALPAQDFRYLYSNTLVFYISILFMFIRYKETKNNIYGS